MDLWNISSRFGKRSIWRVQVKVKKKKKKFRTISITISLSLCVLPPECLAVTAHQSGSVPTSQPWSTTSCRAPSGTRGTRRHPASAAPARSSPWCPSVPPERGGGPLPDGSRPRGTQCWTWRAGTSPTTWSKLTPVLSKPGRLTAEWQSSEIWGYILLCKSFSFELPS